jgi:exodeoxyribonuclease-5
LGKRYVDYELILCATTNKAAEVLSQSTGLETQTIHSFMNLKVFDDYKTGESKVSRTAKWKVHTNKIIFIDEASMIDSKLYEHIIQCTDNTCKIVYLRDHCQMNPVMEDISPVYRKPKHSAILTEPMRNAGQPALIALRHTVETQEFFQIKPVRGVIDYLPPTQAEQFINSTFDEEESGARVLVYSNSRAKEYLEYIRDLRGYPDLFSVGERLISNSSMQFGKTHIAVEEEFVVQEIVKQP